MGYVVWSEETNRPKDAIIKEVFGSRSADVKRTKWLPMLGGRRDILVEFRVGSVASMMNGGVLTKIRNTSVRWLWSGYYELGTNDNPLNHEECMEYGIKW